MKQKQKKQDELDPTEVFNGFDKAKRGKLEAAVAAQALRALSKNPNETQLKEAMEEFGAELSLDDFKKLAKKRVSVLCLSSLLSCVFPSVPSCLTRSPKQFPTPQSQEKEITDAFRTLDNDGTGTILAVELRQILGGLGDALTAQEVGSLLREAKEDGEGGIDYSTFAEMLCYSYTGDRIG
jgi:Ca2+-binding EF-hand superfamily protein